MSNDLDSPLINNDNQNAGNISNNSLAKVDKSNNENKFPSPSTKLDNLRGKSNRTGMADYSNNESISGIRVDSYPSNNK